MAKRRKGKTTPPKGVKLSKSKDDQLLEECVAHEEASEKDLETVRESWSDKEAILLTRVEDKLSKTTANEIFDPVLPEMSLERTARVMAQNPTGKAWAVSKNDVGKNILMNHLHRYWKENANEKWSHLIKLRMLDFYSSVYGSMFALVPWWTNLRTGYIGPEILPIPMRNVRPQPGKVTPDESDWFGVKDRISLPWVFEQAKADPEAWRVNEIAELVKEMKEDEDEGDYPIAEVNAESYIEENLYPTKSGDKPFPQLNTFTEYRNEIWITWAAKRVNNKKSRNHILRIVEDEYPDGLLPVVKKDAFPLLDSMIGLGDFEKGKSLQLGLNSLWNLYMTGVKQSIFPPLHVDPNSVVPSSIKWGSQRWFMDRPNQDVQAMKISPQGLSTFQSTYNYLQSAIQNMYGSSQISQPVGAEGALGKTPEAIKRTAFKEGARDEWDRFMMEETMKAVYKRWTALGVENLDHAQTVRIFGPEIKDLQEAFPNEDILEVFESGKRGNITITKSAFMDQDQEGNAAPVEFDFELDAGSTLKKNPEEESQWLQALLDTALNKPELLDKLNQRGKTIDFAELVKRIMMGSPTKDWDRILVELSAEEKQKLGLVSAKVKQVLGPDGQPVTPELPTVGATSTPPIEGQALPEPPVEGAPTNGEFRDPDIAAAVSGAFPGNQVPPTAVA